LEIRRRNFVVRLRNNKYLPNKQEYSTQQADVCTRISQQLTRKYSTASNDYARVVTFVKGAQ